MDDYFCIGGLLGSPFYNFYFDTECNLYEIRGGVLTQIKEFPNGIYATVKAD